MSNPLPSVVQETVGICCVVIILSLSGLVKHNFFFINPCQALLISFVSIVRLKIILHEGIETHIPRSQDETNKILAPLVFL